MKQTLERGTAMTPGAGAPTEPVLRKRIGSTTYVVSVRFSEISTETLEDKVLRLIESEV